jgi:hypothetical protein
MSHAGHPSRKAGAALTALALAALALAGCALLPLPADTLLLHKSPPRVTATRGGPWGETLEGPVSPFVADEMVDATIGEALRPWLTWIERRELATASQRAAVAVTGSRVAWQAHDGADAATTSGAAMAVGEAYRSVRGRICRDLRQSVELSNGPREQQVTLCHDDQGSGLYVWVVGQADQ